MGVRLEVLEVGKLDVIFAASLELATCQRSGAAVVANAENLVVELLPGVPLLLLQDTGPAIIIRRVYNPRHHDLRDAVPLEGDLVFVGFGLWIKRGPLGHRMVGVDWLTALVTNQSLLTNVVLVQHVPMPRGWIVWSAVTLTGDNPLILS